MSLTNFVVLMKIWLEKFADDLEDPVLVEGVPFGEREADAKLCWDS